MRCDVCDNEVDRVKHIAQTEDGGYEPRNTCNMYICKKCFLDEWDSKTMGYASKKEAEYYFDMFSESDDDGEKQDVKR